MSPATIPIAFTHAQARDLGISNRDLAHTALRRWLNQRGNHPSELLELTRSFPRAMPALRAAIETLQ